MKIVNIAADGRVLSLCHLQGRVAKQKTPPGATQYEVTDAEYNRIKEYLNVEGTGVKFAPGKMPKERRTDISDTRFTRLQPTVHWKPEGMPEEKNILPSILELTWQGPPVTLEINGQRLEAASSPLTVNMLVPGAYRFSVRGMPWEEDNFKKIVLPAPEERRIG